MGMLTRSFSQLSFKGAEKIKDMRIYVKNIKVAKNLLKRSLTAMCVLYLLMLHCDENVDKKFQPSIFYRSRENHV